MNERELVLQALGTNREVSVSELHDRSGLCFEAIITVLHELDRDGHLRRISVHPHGFVFDRFELVDWSTRATAP